MAYIAFLALMFALSTVISVLLIGNRAIVAGDYTFMRIVQIIFSWQFILGAVFAFAARLLFLMINNAVHKIPELEASSTSVTTLITTSSLVFVLIANYIFLDERITPIQMVGACVILLGVILISR